MEFRRILPTISLNLKVLIQYAVLVSLIVLFVLLFIYPVSYKAEISIMPPEKKFKGMGVYALMGYEDIASFISGNQIPSEAKIYREILNSRTIAEYAISKNDLVKFYDVKDMDDAVKKLQKNVEISISKKGVVRLTVEVRTPFFPFFRDRKITQQKCADITNSFADALDSLNNDKNVYKAKKIREYIESEAVRTKKTLDSVEFAFTLFQKRTKTIQMPEQFKSSMENASAIKTDIIKTEIELGIATKTLKEESKIVAGLREKLKQLNAQYENMENGSKDYLLNLNDVPELNQEMLVLMREIRIQSQVYQYLQQESIRVGIEERSDLPTVEMLDRAVPPNNISNPDIAITSIISGVSSFILFAAILIFNENKKRKFLV